MDTSGFKDGATYDVIAAWVEKNYGFHVTNLNIAQTKRKCGIIERQNYNLPKSEDSVQPETTAEKEAAIKVYVYLMGLIIRGDTILKCHPL
ncbi:MAG: 23S rRNA methyltransferase [Clostridiales bacterium]|nr:23S rRNA methyltransferase [Clostridiales bacterium]